MMDVEREALRYAEETLGYEGADLTGTESLGPSEYVVLFDVGGHFLGLLVQTVDGPKVIEELGHTHLMDLGVI